MLTKAETEDSNYRWIDGLKMKMGQTNHEDSYRNLISLIVGSHYVSFQSQTYSLSKDIIKTKEIITKNIQPSEKRVSKDTADFLLKNMHYGRHLFISELDTAAASVHLVGWFTQ